MTSDLLTLKLSANRKVSTYPSGSSEITIRPMTPTDSLELAQIYLEAYPPNIGASTLEEASGEIQASFDGEYGQLLLEASPIALIRGKVVGALMTTTRSIWDDHVEGPFIIDFFVSSAAQGQGVGAQLLEAAISACQKAGAQSLSLRFGEGTSSSAYELYRRFGFQSLH